MSSFSAVPGTRKLALVAGASRGLGLLLARELGDRGYRVVICARDARELAEAQRLLAAHGHQVQTRVCDVSDNDAVTAMVQGIEDGLGPIDVLVTVAGIIQVGPVESLAREHFEQAVSIMLWGPVNLALAVAGPMRRRGSGSIATVTSIGGVVSVPLPKTTATAKFGAVGFSQGLRAELGGSGVSVTTIVPGLMRTGSHLNAMFAGNQKAEYGWFSVGASFPLVSMDAECAARRMVDRVLAGKAMVVLTPLAKIGMRIHGLAPATTIALLGLAGRFLPAAPAGERATITGSEAHERLGPNTRRIMAGITQLGRRAARRFNQTGPTAPGRRTPTRNPDDQS